MVADVEIDLQAIVTVAVAVAPISRSLALRVGVVRPLVADLYEVAVVAVVVLQKPRYSREYLQLN